MDNKETLQSVASATIQEPLVLTVDVKPTGRIHGLLQKWGIQPKQRALTITPIVLGNLMRISKLLVEIDMSIFDVQNLLESNYKAITTHGDAIVDIVAIAVHNGKSEPPGALKSFIKYNFTSDELLACLNLVARQMNVTSFMSSIISMKGFNILEAREVSPQETGETIAPGASLEA